MLEIYILCFFFWKLFWKSYKCVFDSLEVYEELSVRDILKENKFIFEKCKLYFIGKI